MLIYLALLRFHTLKKRKKKKDQALLFLKGTDRKSDFWGAAFLLLSVLLLQCCGLHVRKERPLKPSEVGKFANVLLQEAKSCI